MKVNTLKLKSDFYPDILSHIPTPPQQLYWQGAAPAALLARPRVAIVGSRKATPYGRQITEEIASGLARRGIVVISGLAFGIDSIAHRATLSAGGLTVAVLPSSLNNIYPASHAQLASEILQKGGALVSEYAPGAEAFKVNFIARNRIVSGLADVLLITEAAAASGTMHTARFALEQGKTIMAVPGNINSPLSEGCNNLIKAGAIPITKIEDILFALKIDPEVGHKKIFRGNEQEKLIYDLIGRGITNIEELAISSRLEGGELSVILTMLEISGFIKPLGAGSWALT